MKKRIELHDSNIEKVVVKGSLIEICFKNLVVLNVTDKFGFEFDKTEYLKGHFSLENCHYKSLPISGNISGGHLNIEENRLDLIPIDLKINKPCALFIMQDSNSHMIFCDTFSVQLSP